MSRQKNVKQKRSIQKRKRGRDNYHASVITDSGAPDATYGLPSGRRCLHQDVGSPKIVSVLTSLVRTLTHTVSLCVLIGRTTDELRQLQRALQRRRSPLLRELD